MRSNYTVQASVQFRVLSEDQLEEIHAAALEVLERTGVAVYEAEALELFKKAGAYVDGNRVRVPSHLVEWALRTAPRRVAVANRHGKRTMILEGYNIYFGTGSDCPNILDPYTGERRRCTKQDVANAAKICEALPNIDFVMSLVLVQDKPTPVSDRHQFEAMLLNTTKPIVFTAHDVEGMADIVEMASIVAGGEEELQKNPFIILYAEPSSPLKHSKEAVQKLLYAAEHRIPVIYTPCIMCGATVPATLAGGLVTGTAESLSGLVMHQLKREGSPFITGGVYTIMDMNTTIYSYGAPEFHLLHSALADLAHYYRLPMFSTAGCSDSKILDQQAAAEAAISILMAAQSGANLIHDVGYLEYGLTGSYEMIVMCDEIIGMVKRIIRGIEVNEETLAVEVIDRVGPGGHFLGEEHTLKHFKNETWFPKLINRQRWDEWKNSGGLSLGEKANRKVKQILEEFKPEPLPPDVEARVKEVVNKAERRLGV
ncbi:trimethylamine---corrinoid protein Co-methyltransferase [Thermanaeromonas toyohensis ToBE]|uniref:Trimethylamine---corrinoid protein Co-methyltransferase n=1 Tax=Thermanaeromonas toyohensis ToBE TaxID=698762 RepID=A0A1W1W187_9FIRM|nr:trimethylamine methyltransferase family protein [Thermanaeromonas toyohensis]SMB99336.1 trimethylamine---corrinoid protein Co-methyltransferase [Thermanaeromonas toyohensis ToBE]